MNSRHASPWPGSARRRRNLVVAAALLAAVAGPWAAIGAVPPAGAAGDVAAAPPATAAPPAIYEARAEAGGFTDSLSVPALFETFTPYSRSDAGAGNSSGLHAVFYPGFLLSAAAFQQGFPPPPGTTETLYPQGPFEAEAEFPPVGQGARSDGRVAGSSGRSGPAESSGEAHYGGYRSADFTFSSAETKTAVTAAASTVRSTAEVVFSDVRLGDALVVDSVVAKAEAVADGAPGGARQSGSVVFVGARLLGTPVELTPTGLVVAGTTAPFPSATPIDSLLAQAGLSVRLLPNSEAASADGTESRHATGGVEIRFDRPEREFGVGFVLGRLSVSARAVRAGAETLLDAPVELPVPDAPVRESLTVEPPEVLAAAPLPVPEIGATVIIRRIFEAAPAAVALPAESAVAAPAAGSRPAAALPAAAGASARPVPVRRGDWSGVAGLLVLGGPGAVLLRRLLRVAAAP